MSAKMRILLLSLLLPGCARPGPQRAAVDRDTLTPRQSDSIIGASGMPGAKAIGKAQSAADAEAAHTAAIDSLSG